MIGGNHEGLLDGCVKGSRVLWSSGRERHELNNDGGAVWQGAECCGGK